MSLELATWAVGEVAGELLAAGVPASVMGVTSRGAFLRLGQGVIFLSTEPYRGPLTVNLVGGLPAGLEVGAQVKLGVILSARDGSSGPIPSQNGGRLEVGPGFATRLSQMIELVLAARPDGEASDWLRKLLLPSLPRSPHAESGCLPENRPRISHEYTNDGRSETYSFIRGQIRGWDPSNSTRYPYPSCLLPLLGRGAGLTPWGDDLIIGLLLARYFLQPDAAYDSLAEQLTAAAFTKTSLLSANLIACAALGLADERVLLALSALLSGEPPVHAGADALLGWGSTSGVAALAGMALAILCFTQEYKGE